jgi:hypothetical protein
MFNRIVIVLALVLVGCGPDPLPESLDVRGATDTQMALVEDTVDPWCMATGWCPEIGHTGSVVMFTSDYPLHKRAANKPANFNNGTLRFDNEDWQIQDLNWLWTIVAHELGHFGTKEHTEDPNSVMYTGVHEPVPFCLDQVSVEQFCDESQQCTKQVSTCN